MTEQIFHDENNAYKFDFSAALWATNKLNDIYHQCNIGILSDVDFVFETADKIYLVEYKNACILNAVRPDAFTPNAQKSQNKIAFKFYDSWLYVKAIGKQKPIVYVYILEYPHSDPDARKRIKVDIAKLLPFKLQNLPEIRERMIDNFEVLSIEEWNTHHIFSAFPITPLLHSEHEG